MIAAVAFAALMHAILANPRLHDSVIGAEVYDLDARRPLYQLNAEELMVADSTTKLLTEGTSLALLGPSFTWVTPVYRTGPIDPSGTLHGDLILVASGDPNLSQRIRADNTLAFENEDHSYNGAAVPGDPLTVLRELAKQVAKAGVRAVDGRIIVDTTLFPDQSAQYGLGFVISPITVNDNAIDVTVTPGAKPGDPATIAVSPQTSYARFVDQVTTGAAKSDATVNFTKDVADGSGQRTVTMTGSQPAGSSALYAYGVPDPKLFAQDAFTLALQDAGVAVHVPQTAAAYDRQAASSSFVPSNLVARHVSPPLSADVRITLKVSQNLHAMLMPFVWGAYLAKAQSDVAKAGFARERELLQGAGLPLHGSVQADGAGDFAYFTPDFIVHYLAWMRSQSWYPFLFWGLPVMGVDGTLADIQKHAPARGQVFAKTGTGGGDDLLNNDNVVTKGLAGYIITRSGHHLAFAFYLGPFKGPEEEDTGSVAGQILGAMANAAYLSL
jgi:D-alanyl-D-alanine carboxypeptidase/D-alanyl-D-alanine-endopeptidase (penicillin-binding protein 4)